MVTFYVINRLRHYREEQVIDDVPQWLKSTVEKMHDKEQFSESALENMVALSAKSQEYLTRATQRYYGKTPMQIINEIRINFAKKQLEMTNYSVGNDSNLLIVFYVQIMPDDFVMQLHRF